VEEVARGGEIARAAGERTERLIGALRRLDADGLTAASRLPGWNRLTLALLLGRPRHEPLEITGDVEFGTSFERAFPGP
jgi:hypothetical protein